MGLLSTIVLIVLFKSALCLQPSPYSGKSICDHVLQRTVSRYVPYSETYRQWIFGIFFKTKVRVNYKHEFKSVSFNEKICCTGYQNVSGSCLPECIPPCENGNCYAPNQCTCWKGYRHLLPNETTEYESPKPNESSWRWPSCVLTCQSCVPNLICLRPNDCICKKGYLLTLFNNHTIHCEPICDPPCLNGTCEAPNKCACNGQCEHGACNEREGVCSCQFGWEGMHCKEPTLCSVRITMNDGDYEKMINKLNILDTTDAATIETFDSVPDCERCVDFFDNSSLCFTLNNDPAHFSVVGCLLNTTSPCHIPMAYNGFIVYGALGSILIFALVFSLAFGCVYLTNRERIRTLRAVRTGTQDSVQNGILSRKHLIPAGEEQEGEEYI